MVTCAIWRSGSSDKGTGVCGVSFVVSLNSRLGLGVWLAKSKGELNSPTLFHSDDFPSQLVCLNLTDVVSLMHETLFDIDVRFF